MGYPYSISKSITINLSDLQGNPKQSIDYFVDKLKEVKCDIIKDGSNRISIKECVEFSSNYSRLKDLNRGEIEFEISEHTININSRIIVFEHFIPFIGILILAVFGIMKFQESPEILGVSLVALLANFIFFYLIPLMTFYSFFNGTINKLLLIKE